MYFLASLAHFTNNAEYIAYYPNMPAWITRETVYLAWLAITSIGVAGIALSRVGWRVLGAVALAAYGTFGLDGLALCCAVLASRLLKARAEFST